MKRIITVDGTQCAVWIDLDEGTIEFAGDSEQPQYVPKDRYTYAYSQGGALFRAACDLFWDLEEARSES